MSAKEMFEQLGYECSQNKYEIKYIKDSDRTTITILFYLDPLDKDDEYANISIDDDYDNYAFDYSKKLHLAINEQMKELGWL